MYRDVNETYLLHGTSPGVILSIVTAGVNERFTTVALFGKGSYFAEDSAKVDQYVQGDSVLGSNPELHRELFPKGGEFNFPVYPLKAYYIFVCRYVAGFHVSVRSDHGKGGKGNIFTNLTDRRADIWVNDDKRELGMIPGIGNPPFAYHSLLAELGGTILRFREFCQFHSTRIYPEYLVCYCRK